MQTLEHRVGILEKRVDNHGEEIDDLDDRVVEVEEKEGTENEQ